VQRLHQCERILKRCHPHSAHDLGVQIF
jgi:hypothetical protein